eukprot:TRINITY_DN3569_c0_g2_i3.p1 TRINITY_DN3569_c0_g2~~TRINITY_DN3569_c0_g2_i3.p1  ORF type:complete len:226 (+),score=13.03 TRINITY_DN3569_c0_g2_i3:92-679(+)
MPEYDARYNEIWSKLAARRHIPVINWRRVATIALHAAPPNVLDNFWEDCVNNVKIDGPLIVRFTCAAAGTAAFNALDAGVKDVATVFPAINKILEDELKYLKECVDVIARNRWDHCVNARLYGADTRRLTENDLGALGSLISACSEAIAVDSKLKNSEALKRVAKIAPITGAAYTIAIKKYVGSDNFANNLALTQ